MSIHLSFSTKHYQKPKLKMWKISLSFPLLSSTESPPLLYKLPNTPLEYKMPTVQLLNQMIGKVQD